MSFSKSLGTLVATALIGSVTLLMAGPKKLVKTRIKTVKATEQNGIEENQNLFI